jgi:hypothetical protein
MQQGFMAGVTALLKAGRETGQFKLVRSRGAPPLKDRTRKFGELVRDYVWIERRLIQRKSRAKAAQWLHEHSSGVSARTSLRRHDRADMIIRHASKTDPEMKGVYDWFNGGIFLEQCHHRGRSAADLGLTGDDAEWFSSWKSPFPPDPTRVRDK